MFFNIKSIVLFDLPLLLLMVMNDSTEGDKLEPMKMRILERRTEIRDLPFLRDL